jgi:elongation factor Ts
LIGNYNHDGRIGVLVEVNCETDFVARGEIFQEVVRDIAMHIAAAAPLYVSADEVPEEDKAKIKAEFVDKAKSEGKPADMVDKIVDGQLQKYFGERCLLDQPFVKNPDQTVADYVKENAARMNENVVVRRFSRLALGELS